MTITNQTHRPSEEAALDRAINSMDSNLRASLQRDQNQRRRKLVFGVILMSLLVGLMATVFFYGGFSQPNDDRAGVQPDQQKAETLSQEGWQLWQKRKLIEAEAKFVQAVKLGPKLDHAWNGLGWSRFNQGKTNEAIEAFQQCVSITPNHGAGQNGLGQAFYVQGKMELAEKHFLKAKNASAAWWGLMKVYLLKEDFGKAKKYLGKIANSGHSNRLELQSFQDAIDSKTVSDELRMQLTPTASKAESPSVANLAALNAKAWQLFRQGKNAEAEVAFQKILDDHPDHAAAVNGKAFSLLNGGKATEAKPLFEKLLASEPKHYGAMNGLARCYKAEGEMKKAIELWEKMEAALPDVSASTYGLAEAYVNEERYEQAEKLYKKILSAHPDDAQTAARLKLVRTELKKSADK